MIGMPLFFNFYGGFDGNAGIGSSIYNYFRRLGNSFPFWYYKYILNSIFEYNILW